MITAYLKKEFMIWNILQYSLSIRISQHSFLYTSESTTTRCLSHGTYHV